MSPCLLFSDIDECEYSDLNICNTENGTCVNSIGSYSCHCNTGYTGDGSLCNGKIRCHLIPTIYQSYITQISMSVTSTNTSVISMPSALILSDHMTALVLWDTEEMGKIAVSYIHIYPNNINASLHLTLCSSLWQW